MQSVGRGESGQLTIESQILRLFLALGDRHHDRGARQQVQERRVQLLALFHVGHGRHQVVAQRQVRQRVPDPGSDSGLPPDSELTYLRDRDIADTSLSDPKDDRHSTPLQAATIANVVSVPCFDAVSGVRREAWKELGRSSHRCYHAPGQEGA